MAEKLAYRYDIYIGAPAGRVWQALVDGDLTKQYVYGTKLQSKLKKGATYAYVGEGDFHVVEAPSFLRASSSTRYSLACSSS